ncbi:MAG TPA: hypothetical protein VF636_01365 [Sphingomonas sp.]|jgi:hypothetical protein
MTGVTMDRIGEELAKTQRQRIARVWIETLILALVAGVLMGVAVAADTPAVRWTLIALTLPLVARALWIGTVHYMRTIDEQELAAVHWSSTVGLYCYVMLYGSERIGEKLGYSVADAHDLIFLAVLIITVVAFLWKRYR